MKARKIAPGELFGYCRTERQVYSELHKSVEVASSEMEIEHLDAAAIAAIMEIRKKDRE